MEFVFICLPELQENAKGILKSPLLSFHCGHFNEKGGINSFYSFLTQKLGHNIPHDCLGFNRTSGFSLVPEISLHGIFHSSFW